MNELNQTIIDIINNRILGNFETITALNEYSLQVILGGLTLLIVILGINHASYKGIISLEIKKQLEKEKEEFKREAHNDLKRLMNQYKYKSQKEEFLRNLIFKDLINLLASELQEDKLKNINEKFTIYADRLEIVTQLTSGDEKEVSSALIRLATGKFSKIIRYKSFHDYIEILENQSIMYLKEELSILKNIMSQ